MSARYGSLEELGVGEMDVTWPPPHQRPLTWGEQWEREHRDAPDQPRGEDR